MSIPANVFLNVTADDHLQSIIQRGGFDMIAVLVDENTRQHCLPRLHIDDQVKLIEIESGEEQKTLATCEKIWQQMTDMGLSRKSLMVNLGGGVIGDMGGFVASTYKRGIPFVNIPTTLLAQVDASIGGKLGVDFHGLKNHIGLFQEPLAVLVDTEFLDTLSFAELRSGFAEMLKHGLIMNQGHWKELTSEPFNVQRMWSDLLPVSVGVKGQVVAEDPLEHGLRKILNLGHTLGHAIETHFLGTKERMLHGEAIAAGMILEAYLSVQVCGLPQESLDEITKFLISTYGKKPLPSVSQVTALMKHDKKNVDGKVSFSLLQSIGTCRWDQQVSHEQIEAAFGYYESLDE